MLFSIQLHAIDASRNCRRNYRLTVAQDLFGDCLVSLTYGRVGTPGRTIVKVADNETHARQLAKIALRRRDSAPRRIGVAYRSIEHFAAPGWAVFLDALAVRPLTPRR